MTSFNLPVFETQRLRLRPFKEDDFSFLRELDTDPEVVRYLGQGKVRSEEESRKNFSRLFDDYEKYGLGLYVVEDRQSGEKLGRSGLIPWTIDGQLYWEIGYTFKPSAWGKGYASECSQFLAKWAQEHTYLSFVVSFIHPENKNSIHVAEKYGARFWKEISLNGTKALVYHLGLRQVQAIVAVLQFEDKFLLGKRSPHKKSAPGYWCPVTGKIESGESETAAFSREVKEETGLLIKPLKKLCEINSRDGHIRLHWWLGNATSLNVTMNDEHTEMGWFTLNEIEQLFPIFHEDVELLRSLR